MIMTQTTWDDFGLRKNRVNRGLLFSSWQRLNVEYTKRKQEV